MHRVVEAEVVVEAVAEAGVLAEAEAVQEVGQVMERETAAELVHVRGRVPEQVSDQEQMLP